MISYSWSKSWLGRGSLISPQQLVAASWIINLSYTNKPSIALIKCCWNTFMPNNKSLFLTTWAWQGCCYKKHQKVFSIFLKWATKIDIESILSFASTHCLQKYLQSQKHFLKHIRETMSACCLVSSSSYKNFKSELHGFKLEP